MAQYVKISYIVKTDHLNPHERIQSMGGVNPDGTRWKLNEDKAISYIEDDTYEFYVERPAGQRVSDGNRNRIRLRFHCMISTDRHRWLDELSGGFTCGMTS